ncbi:hypothetical protein B0H13DRAFT_1023183, partial [Mycena leptocephala]
PTVTASHLKSITTCLDITADTLEILAHSLRTPFLNTISNTTRSLLQNIQVVKQNKDNCIQLLEQTYELLNAILTVYLTSNTDGELPPNTLNHIGNFTQTLYKIHTFVEAQQKNGKVKNFFRQGEMSTLLKECKAGLQQGFDLFQIKKVDLLKNIEEMQEEADKIHDEVLGMIEALSDTSSDRASSISRVYSASYNSSNSISMLPAEPKIFNGRQSELFDILCLFSQGTPRVAILGAGGMGKTALARAIIHHEEIAGRYNQQRFFVGCDSASTQTQLVALIGAHIGLKPAKDLTHAVIHYFSSSPQSLLILDNLETLWEPTESRKDMEEFLALLTGVDHLALVITMRGAERPVKVAWTRPFLQPLKPLDQNAARQTFIDITDTTHNLEEVDKVLSLTDNMPLAIDLLAHLVDSEGCSTVLSSWEAEKTALISQGYDRKSNLELSISLSLSSPRLNSFIHSKDLLSILSMLPDGLSDAELVQSNLPIENILGCKTALIRTALAYNDENKRLKALVPIREYMQKIQPPENHLVHPLLKHFQQLLELFKEYHGTQSGSAAVGRITSNYSNIQSVLRNSLRDGHPDLVDSIYCTCYLNQFSLLIGQKSISLIDQIHDILPPPSSNHRLHAYFIMEVIRSWLQGSASSPELLTSEALEHFKHFDDPDLKCEFYMKLAVYHRVMHNISTAQEFCELAISIALSTGNTKMYSQVYCNLAMTNWHLGNYSAGQVHAHEARKLARSAADLYREAQALNIEAMCCYALGNYNQSISLCNRARDLVTLCAMCMGDLDHCIMTTQAEVHKLKSEYVQARSIHTLILCDSDPFTHAFALFNIAEIDVSISAPQEVVLQNNEMARNIFSSRGFVAEIGMCDTVFADLYLREGNELAAKNIFEKYITDLGNSETVSYCLERLGNTVRWGSPDQMSNWTAVFLLHSLKQKEKLSIHKALQFLGDVSLAQDDDRTAISLFTVALEGFTYMDVHRSRADCMLRLGDIFMRHGNLLKAVQLWETAR